MADLIQVKRGSTAYWETINPVLAQGEPALEIDTNKIKIGNAVTPWIDLPYLDVGGGSYPVITLFSRPFRLKKTVNVTDASLASTLETLDIVEGSPADGEWGSYQYKGGDQTNINNFEIITGI